MNTSTHTIERAISRSISHTEIVTLTPADDQEHDLLCEALDEVCDDSAAADGWTEYWGTDGDDHEWRVHVRLSEVAS